MSIKLKSFPEPLSPESRRADRPVVLIDSRVAETLKRDLRRYRDGEIDGKSFLIAGHRGAGKTTLVKGAILDVLKERGEDVRPLMVLLHGPNLFDTGDEADRLGIPQQEGEEEQPFRDPVSRALVQIILRTYRALAEEVVNSYRQRLEERRRITGRVDVELFERAAQLEVELDGFPEPDRLRDFWNAAGFLHDGVLFEQLGSGGRAPARPGHSDQGFRELVALYTGSLLYKRISGEFKKAETTRTDTLSAAQTAGSEEEGGEESAALKGAKQMASGVLSLAAGALAGLATFAAGEAGGATPPTGLLPGVPQAVEAVLVGLFTLATSSVLFRFSWSRTRDRSLARNEVFEEDLGRETLDRKVPLLIRRIHKAGLVPVFVVDELDKVQDLSGQIRTLIPHLKKLVAEQGFFCFLTDRTFFERVERRAIQGTYPIEYTYFSDWLFVVFDPEAMHRYLRQVLEVTGAGDTARPPAPQVRDGGSPAAAGPAPGGDGTGSAGDDEAERREDLRDLEVLPYLLLRRSEMHAVDLRRQLATFVRQDGALDLPRGRVRSSSAFAYDLLLQVAVEMVLAEPLLGDRIAASPAFGRMALDVLYYPMRRRRAGQEILDLTREGRDAFRLYLERRMVPDRDRDAGELGARTPEGELPQNQPAGEFLYEHEVDALFGAVQRLATLLADPFEFLDRLGQWNRSRSDPLADAVLDALPVGEPTGPPLEEVWDGDPRRPVYRWAVTESGSAIRNRGRSLAATRIDLLYRLGVRTLLAGDPARVRDLQRSPDLRARVHSALLVPIERWRDDPDTEDFHGGLFRDLRRQLRELHADPGTRRVWRRLIVGLLRELGPLLADPAALLARARESTAWNEAFELLRGKLDKAPAAVAWARRSPSGALERAPAPPSWPSRSPPDERPLLAWQYTWAGDPRFEDLAPSVEPWEEALDMLKAVGEALAEQWNGAASLERLQGDLGLLPTSPSWTYLRDEALPRLSSYRESRQRYEVLEDDKEQVTRMGVLLVDEAELLGRVLVLAEAVARACPSDDAGSTFRAAMEAVFHAGLPWKQGVDVSQEGLTRRFPDVERSLRASPGLDYGSYERWVEWLDGIPGGVEAQPLEDLAAVQEGAWREWLHGAGSPPGPDAMADRVLALALAGRDTFLATPREALGVAAWSDVAARAARGLPPEAPDHVPESVLPEALRALHIPPEPDEDGAATRVLIVRSPGGGAPLDVGSWPLPGRHVGALVVDGGPRLRGGAFHSGHRAVLARLRPTHVAFLQPVDSDVVARVRSAFDELGLSTDVVLLAAVEDREHRPAGLLRVERPQRVEDLTPAAFPGPQAARSGEAGPPWPSHRLEGVGSMTVEGPAGLSKEILRALLRTPMAQDATAQLTLVPRGATAATVRAFVAHRTIRFHLTQSDEALHLRVGLFHFRLSRSVSAESEGLTLEAHGTGRLLGVGPRLSVLFRGTVGDVATVEVWIGRRWTSPVAHLTGSFRLQGTDSSRETHPAA